MSAQESPEVIIARIDMRLEQVQSDVAAGRQETKELLDKFHIHESRLDVLEPQVGRLQKEHDTRVAAGQICNPVINVPPSDPVTKVASVLAQTGNTATGVAVIYFIGKLQGWW